MIITHGTEPAPSQPVALTIGNFDGVHRGHEAMVAHVRAVALERKLTSCVLTFEPHPRELFAPSSSKTRPPVAKPPQGARPPGRPHSVDVYLPLCLPAGSRLAPRQHGIV